MPLIKFAMTEVTVLWIEYEVTIRRNDIDDFNRELRELNERYEARAIAKNKKGE